MTTGEKPPVRHGPHGGPLVELSDGLVELSVFETGVPPRFRLYFFDRDQGPRAPFAPNEITIETIRPDGKRQLFAFRADDGFLDSTSDIPEPHEFDVVVTVVRAGASSTYEAHFTEEGHAHGGPGHDDHGHGHGHGGGHGHKHGFVDPMITTTTRGLWAIKWSFVALMVTASIQLVVVIISGSVALLADMIHNFGDAGTAIPLGIAFLFARRPANRRFTYGFGRVEDLAGLAVVLLILGSAAFAAYAAIDRLQHPETVTHLGTIVVASIVGFLGNEGVAVFRIKVGKEIGSAALIADGYHARTDGWTSLAVLGGAIGVHLGYPLADPIVGLLITATLLIVVWQSVKAVLARMLDGVEPEYMDTITETATKVPGVQRIADVRARWIGHRIRAEVSIVVPPEMTVADAHAIATEVEHRLKHDLTYLSAAVIHLDPGSHVGETAHRVEAHEHDGLDEHAH